MQANAGRNAQGRNARKARGLGTADGWRRPGRPEAQAHRPGCGYEAHRPRAGTGARRYIQAHRPHTHTRQTILMAAPGLAGPHLTGHTWPLISRARRPRSHRPHRATDLTGHTGPGLTGHIGPGSHRASSMGKHRDGGARGHAPQHASCAHGHHLSHHEAGPAAPSPRARAPSQPQCSTGTLTRGAACPITQPAPLSLEGSHMPSIAHHASAPAEPHQAIHTPSALRPQPHAREPATERNQTTHAGSSATRGCVPACPPGVLHRREHPPP